MKRVVFLFALFALALNTTSSGAILGNGTYEFDTYDITLTYFRDENKVRGYHIDKYGSEPFSISYQRQDGWIELEDVVEINGNHVFIGRLHILEDGYDPFYRGFIMIYSTSGQKLEEIVIEKEEDVEMKYLFQLDGIIMGIMESYERTDDQVHNYYYTTFDSEFNIIDELEVCHPYYSDMAATDKMVLYNYNYDDIYEGGYTTDLQWVSPDDPLLISTDEVFVKEVFIPFLNEATLNGESVRNGVFIDYPGLYQLHYLEHDYSFVVDPIIDGVEDGAIYQDPVQILFSSGRATLNDDLIVSGEYVEEPGEYTLSIEGVGNYVKEIQFTIDAHVEGVINNQSYQEEVTLDFNGSGYLNDTYITPPYTVTEPGDYILSIKGENDYLETYYFTIEEPEESHNVVDFLKDYDIVILGIAVVGGLLILKKK